VNLTPYYDRDGITLYLGRCEDVLPQIGLVDAIITDPPYNIGTPQLITFDNHGQARQRREVGKDFGVFDEGAVGPETWMPIARSTLKEGGVIVSFYGAKAMERLLTADKDLQVIQDFHWIKPAPAVPMRSVGFSWGTESGYIFRRAGEKHKHNNDAGISPNWFLTHRCSNNEMVGHPTQKPFELARWLVNHWSFPDQTICDPFLGSGTFAVAAKDLGRRCIGIEINEGYLKIAIERLRQGVLL